MKEIGYKSKLIKDYLDLLTIQSQHRYFNNDALTVVRMMEQLMVMLCLIDELDKVLYDFKKLPILDIEYHFDVQEEIQRMENLQRPIISNLNEGGMNYCNLIDYVFPDKILDASREKAQSLRSMIYFYTDSNVVDVACLLRASNEMRSVIIEKLKSLKDHIEREWKDKDLEIMMSAFLDDMNDENQLCSTTRDKIICLERNINMSDMDDLAIAMHHEAKILVDEIPDPANESDFSKDGVNHYKNEPFFQTIEYEADKLEIAQRRYYKLRKMFNYRCNKYEPKYASIGKYFFYNRHLLNKPYFDKLIEFVNISRVINRKIDELTGSLDSEMERLRIFYKDGLKATLKCSSGKVDENFMNDLVESLFDAAQEDKTLKKLISGQSQHTGLYKIVNALKSSRKVYKDDAYAKQLAECIVEVRPGLNIDTVLRSINNNNTSQLCKFVSDFVSNHFK